MERPVARPVLLTALPRRTSVPSRASRARGLLARLAAVVSVGVALHARPVARRAPNLDALAPPREHGDEPPPPLRLDEAAQVLAARRRRPLYVAPDLGPRAAHTAQMDVILAVSGQQVYGLDLFAEPWGLWFHEAAGVLRLEPAVTAVDFDCEGRLDECAVRLERVASVRVSLPLRANTHRVRIHLSRNVPAIEGTPAALVAGGFTVRVRGRTLHIDAPRPRVPTRWGAAPMRIRRVGGQFLISRDVVDAVLENREALMRTTRLLPYEEGGRVVGVRVSGIRADGLLARLGLRDNDIVTHLDERELAAPGGCMGRPFGLRDPYRFTLSLVRAGRALRLVYDIE